MRAASGGNPAGKGLGVEPIELLVVVERVVVEEEEALYLGEPSEGEHLAEAGVPPADATRVLLARVLAVAGEERGAICEVEAGERAACPSSTACAARLFGGSLGRGGVDHLHIDPFSSAGLLDPHPRACTTPDGRPELLQPTSMWFVNCSWLASTSRNS